MSPARPDAPGQFEAPARSKALGQCEAPARPEASRPEACGPERSDASGPAESPKRLESPEPPESRTPHKAIFVATRAHADVMAEIHRAAFPPAESWSRDVMILQLDLPATFGFVHLAGGMILARVAADESEILTVAVYPGRQRRGIASALLSAAMAHAGGMGAVSMFLEVAVTNGPARALYEAHGFTLAGSRRHYYSDGTDALILRCTLPAAIAKS